MTEINERNDDAYYDAYDEDIVAGHVKPVRTTLRTSPGSRVSDDELDAIFRGRPNLGENHATGTGRSPPPTRRSPSTSEPTALPGVPSSATPSRSTSPAPEPRRPDHPVRRPSCQGWRPHRSGSRQPSTMGWIAVS